MSKEAASDAARRVRSDPKKEVTKAAKQVKDAASTAGGYVNAGVDGIGDLFGGYKELDKTIKSYNPTFCKFVDKFMSNVSFANRPSKFLLLLIGLGILQSIIPIFQWPLDFLSRMLGFLFLYNTGLDELKAGYASSRSAPVIKSLLTVFFIASAFQLIPGFVFDTQYHFGALWNFFMPVLFFTTPSSDKSTETIAVMISDLIFAPLSSLLQSLSLGIFDNDSSSFWTMLACGIVGLLFWAGYLGATGSYVCVWAFLAFMTIIALGKTFISKDDSSSGYTIQMTIWHNLLAMWLWRYLVSTVESMAIPGVISVLGLILHYLPSYFLWLTGFFALMLWTKRTASKMKADTWYARWLMGGGLVPPKKESSSSSSGSSSSSRPSGSSSSSRPSGSSSRSSSDKPSSSRPSSERRSGSERPSGERSSRSSGKRSSSRK